MVGPEPDAEPRYINDQVAALLRLEAPDERASCAHANGVAAGEL